MTDSRSEILIRGPHASKTDTIPLRQFAFGISGLNTFGYLIRCLALHPKFAAQLVIRQHGSRCFRVETDRRADLCVIHEITKLRRGVRRGGPPMIQPTRRKLQRIDTVAGPVETVGAAVLLQREKLGLICSRKCPGNIIVKTYEFARLVRGSSLAILSGFHSPIEKDCLPILLRTQGPIIIALGHRLNSSRLPMD
jgi:hypothetical protein